MTVSFLFPQALYFLPTVLIPVVLHLVHLRRAKKIKFSSIKFFIEAVREKQKKRRLSDILLLITRMCILASIALLFSQPYLSNVHVKGKHVCIIIDNSKSMERKKEGKTLLQLALENISKHLKASYTIITTSPPRIVCENSRRIPHILTSYIPPDFFKALSLANKITKKYGGSIMIISDFRIPPLKLPKDAIAINCDKFAEPDVIITKVSLSPMPVIAGEKAILKVEIKNISNFKIKKYPIKIYLKNQKIAETIVDLDAKQIKQLSFTLIFPQAAISYLKIEGGKDSLSEDNLYFLPVEIKPKIKVLIVGNNKYVEAALKAADIFEIQKTSQPFPEAVQPFDIVIYCDYKDTPLLKACVTSREKNIFFLKFESPYFPVSGKLLKLKEPEIMQPVTQHSEIFAGFPADFYRDLFVYAAFKPARLSSIDPIFKLKSFPLVFYYNNNLFFCTEPSPKYTSLPLTPYFLPILVRLIRNMLSEPPKILKAGTVLHLTSFQKLVSPSRKEYSGKGDIFLDEIGIWQTEKFLIGVNFPPEELLQESKPPETKGQLISRVKVVPLKNWLLGILIVLVILEIALAGF